MAERVGPEPVAAVDALVVAPAAGGAPVVDGAGFTLHAGEVLGITGRSGSGKTTTALALFGHVRAGLVRRDGRVRVGGVDPFAPGGARRVRGHRATYLGQDPGAALNPRRRLGDQVGEAVRLRRRPGDPRPSRAQVRDEVGALLRSVSLPGEVEFLRRFPHQVSGGQARRVALAVALAGGPDLLVLDEPTAGLDPVVAAEVRAMLGEILPRCAAVLVSHDAHLVAALAGRALAMHDGRVVADGPPTQLPARTRTASRPGSATGPPAVPGSCRAGAAEDPALVVDGVHAAHGRVVVAEDVSFTVARGQCLALVGPSGSGKTTVARAVAGLHPPSSGRVLLDGAVLAGRAARRDPGQRRAIALVAQDSVAALNPRETVAAALARPLRLLRGCDAVETEREIARLLERVHLPAVTAGRRPGGLSGGERQRVNLARALAGGPSVLVCDEITSALDPGIGEAVTDLVDELRRDENLTVLMVTHDEAVLARCADRIAVLDGGRIR